MQILTILLVLTCSISTKKMFVDSHKFERSFDYKSDSITTFQNNCNQDLNFHFCEKGNYDSALGNMRDVYIVDELAYAAIEGAGLVIFDISNLSNPIIVSCYDDSKPITEDVVWDSFDHTTSGLYVKNGLVYLADGLNGLVIINVSDLTNPQKIGHYKIKSGGISNVIVSGSNAFVKSTKKVKIIDISDPTSPFLTGEISLGIYSTESINSIAVNDNFVFISSEDFIIYDVSIPSNPTEIARITDFLGTKIIIRNNIVYYISFTTTGNTSNHLHTIDISNPNSPVIIGNLSLSKITDNIQSIVVSNTTAYIASSVEIVAINVTNSSNLIYLGKTNNSTLVWSMKRLALQSNLDQYQDMTEIVFCADEYQGFLIIDFSNVSDPCLINTYHFGSSIQSLSIDENLLALAYGKSLITIPNNFENLSNGNVFSFNQVGSFSLNNSSISDVHVEDDYVYVSLYLFGLGILDVSTPLEPKLIGLFNLTSIDSSIYAKRLFYDKEKDFVVITMANDGYAIIDVSNKTNPTLLYHGEKWRADIVDVFVSNNLLFIAESYYDSGFGIINITNPVNPIWLNYIPFGEIIYDIYIDGDLLFLSTELCPIKIYDVSNSLAPIKLSEIKSDRWHPGQIFVNNSIAFIAQNANGLLAIDVSSPIKPKLLTSYRDHYAGLSYDVVVYNNYIFLADGWDGLEILELVPPVISRRQLLLFSILPSLSGSVLVAVIVILQFSKKRKKNN